MKKILGAVAGIALVYVGICFSLGFVAETSLKEQIDFHNTKAGKLNGVNLELKNFSRGIFGSEMDIAVRFTSVEPTLQLLSITSHSKIQNGPLLFLNGFSFGAYAIESTLVVTTADETTNTKLKSIFGDSIGLIRINYGFTKTYSGNWVIEPIDITEEGTQIKVDKSIISFEGDFKDMQAPNMTGDINIGAVLIKNAVTNVTMEPWVGKVDQKFVDSIPIGNMTLGTKKISVQGDMGFPVMLENFSIEQKQQITDKKLNTLVALRLEKFTGPLEVNNSFYQVEFNNIPVAGLKKIYELLNAAESSSPEQQLMTLLPALSNILVDGIEFKLGLGSELMEGKLLSDFTLLYHAAADGKSPLEMQSPDEILKLFSANFNVSVSESIVNQTPMAEQIQPLIGTYVTVENGVYHLKANLKDTAVTVGTQTIPAEQYMPLLMMAAMGMTAGGDVPADEYEMEAEADTEIDTSADTEVDVTE